MILAVIGFLLGLAQPHVQATQHGSHVLTRISQIRSSDALAYGLAIAAYDPRVPTVLSFYLDCNTKKLISKRPLGAGETMYVSAALMGALGTADLCVSSSTPIRIAVP